MRARACVHALRACTKHECAERKQVKYFTFHAHNHTHALRARARMRVRKHALLHFMHAHACARMCTRTDVHAHAAHTCPPQGAHAGRDEVAEAGRDIRVASLVQFELMMSHCLPRHWRQSHRSYTMKGAYDAVAYESPGQVSPKGKSHSLADVSVRCLFAAFV